MSQELWIIFIFGLGFLITRVVLAVHFPIPTKDQEAVFRTMLSLSAAGIAAVIPGLMKFESQAATTTISATGALAVFVLVYLMNPASARHTSSSKGGTGNGSNNMDEDIQPLLHKLNELTDEVRALAMRIEQLEEQPAVDTSFPEPSIRPKNRIHRILIALFASALLCMLVVYAVAFPEPTRFQAVLLRVVFALTGAGLGALIPGTLNVTYGVTSVLLRAVGALALFIIIYFFSAVSVLP